jgi:hypothetical protein
MIGDTAVALTPAGLVVAGTTTPVSASPLQPVLDGAGVSVRPLATETTPDGVVSAGLVVTRTQELPTAISPVTVTYTFGRALAAVSPVALPAIGAGETIAPLPGPSSGAGAAGGDSTGSAGGDEAGPATASGSAGDAALPSTASGAGALAGAGSAATTGGVSGAGTEGGNGAAGEGTSATGAAAGEAPVVGTAVPVRRVGTRLFDLSAIYLLLVAAAATAGAVIQFVRHAGVGV